MSGDPSLPACHLVRKRLRVRGVVQGVGFRPHIYRLATRHHLTGFVGNDTLGVFLEIQGMSVALEQFQHDLLAEAPALARIESVAVETLSAKSEQEFVIVPSESAVGAVCSVPADVGICADCLRELFDPNDRRHLYPFINCTNCGPRFTILRKLPYDRPATTMARFKMCQECEREYHDPASRRFHAQPIACPACGPEVWLEHNQRCVAARQDAIVATLKRLRDAQIIAIKGIGGFHLACDATSETAVQRLRERKGRGWKPFAVMVHDLGQARRYAIVSDVEARLLERSERPIVLLNRMKDSDRLAEMVAPGTDTIGLLLPYSPLHYLLLKERPLVMTSGNRSDEPIVCDNAEASLRLAGLADAFLMHNREIHSACDDSVIREFDGHEYPIRRSRGYAPLPVRMPRHGRSVLAVGGEMKATLCLTVGEFAYLSPHIGDVDSPETLEALGRTADHLLDLFQVEPEAVACDLHPGYHSAEWAARYAKQKHLPLVRILHHHAHLASLLVDSRSAVRPVLGICFDGTGYGTDAAIWGGEFLLADTNRVRRVGHLRSVPMPGGDAAVRRPYRIALAHLWASSEDWNDRLPCVVACPLEERRVLRQQLERNIGSVPASSMGRLFDAVAALTGIRQVVSYEAQAAIEMEACPEVGVGISYPVEIRSEMMHVIDTGPLIAAIASDVLSGVPAGVIITRFHETIAEVIDHVACLIRERHGIDCVGLTGGVFQNLRLLRRTHARLQRSGFGVLTHCQVPANDGGLSLGQAAICSGSLPFDFQSE